MIEAEADYGYSHSGNRRKVVLWSKTPWVEVDSLGCHALPSGRFVAGTTGGIRFVGVCIPWKDAHVTTGRKDRVRWEDHLSYCAGLEGILATLSDKHSQVCLLGDFNQRIPRINEPEAVALALRNVFPSNFTVSTSEMLDGDGKPLIDHLVVSDGVTLSGLQVIPKLTVDGTRLSDHAGVWGLLRAN
jgi:hypothetical protein